MTKFLIGVFVGSVIGMITMALAVAAKNADRDLGIKD